MGQGNDVDDLLQGAVGDGALSGESARALAVPDIGAMIQAGLGIAADDVTASEVVLVTTLVDDSGSIRFAAGNAQVVRDGHNLVIEALRGTKQKDGILAHTRYLNGLVLYPYLPLDQAILMDQNNYDPSGGTPLYDQTMVILGTVLAKTQEFIDNGVPVRTVTLIVTDGADAGSRRFTDRNVAKLVADMMLAETHIVAAMGIDDGGHTDFIKVFQGMGIRDKWILTPGNSPSEIRQAFQVFSQSAVRASQGSASFSKVAIGGFGG